MTDPTFEIPLSPVPLLPKPAACQEPTVASYTVRSIEQVWGQDTEVAVMRSCGHGPYFWSSRNGDLPEVGEPAMTCLGPQVEPLASGRADPTLPPMKKGRRWTRLKASKVA